MYEKALQKIKEGERCKPNFCCYSIVGPTGATHALFSESKGIFLTIF